jgi:hypothetical protein
LQRSSEATKYKRGQPHRAQPTVNPDTPDRLLPARINVVEINAYTPRPFVFSELALCLRDALRRAGVASDHLINRSEPGVPHIVFVPTDGWEAFVADLDPRQTVLFNMEQLGSDAPWTRDGYALALKRWTVADYNASNVDWLRRHNGAAQRVQEIPIVPGPSVAFAGAPDAAPVDVLFFGTMNARREQVLAQLREAGLSVESVAGSFGWELTPAILRARLVLHVHFYETRLFPVARILQPVAQGVPVVCESSVCSPLADWSAGSGIVFAETDRLVDTCRELLADPARQLRSVQQSLRFAQRLDITGPLQALWAELNRPA